MSHLEPEEDAVERDTPLRLMDHRHDLDDTVMMASLPMLGFDVLPLLPILEQEVKALGGEEYAGSTTQRCGMMLGTHSRETKPQQACRRAEDDWRCDPWEQGERGARDD